MSEYSMTQLSMKQNIFDSHVKRLKRLNAMLAEMCVLDMDEEVLSSIEDICKDVVKCSNSIKEAAEETKSYVYMAKLTMFKDLDSTLSSWEKSKQENAAVLAEGKLRQAIDPDDDEDVYVLTADAINKGAF